MSDGTYVRPQATRGAHSHFVPHLEALLVGVEPLTTEDACDRCGTQAVVRVVLASNKELVFCRTHIDVHGRALEGLRSRFCFGYRSA